MLALPYIVSVLGYAAGPLLLAAVTAVAALCGCLLAEAYKVGQVRHPTFLDALFGTLGRRTAAAIVVIRYLKLALIGVAYTVAATAALQNIARFGCQATHAESCERNRRVFVALLCGGV